MSFREMPETIGYQKPLRVGSGIDERQSERAVMGMQPSGLYFMTPVWGEAYTGLFLDVVIPSQLAPGNLPGLYDTERCRYLIFTTLQDANVITASPQYRALSNIIPVQVLLIDGEIKAPHNTMSECFRQGIAMADEANAASIFLTPDLVFSDGSFRTLQRLVIQGRRVIYITGIRLIKQPAVSALRDKFLRGGVIAAEPNDLMDIALRNLHPLAYSSFWEEGEEDLIPANLYWRVGSKGILARCFHLHPVLVYPEVKRAVFFGTVDDDYVLASCPDAMNDYVVRDSDELLAVELSELGHFFLTGMRKGSFADVAFWAEMAANSRHRTLIDVPIRLHCGKIQEDDWREVERTADRIVVEISSLLCRSSVDLLMSNRRMLERRLVRLAQEKRLQLENHSSETLAHPQRTTLQIKASALRLSCIKLSTRLFQVGPIRLFFLLFDAYCKAARKCWQALIFVRTLIYGASWRPTPFNLSWIYIRQLSKDVVKVLAGLDSDVVICGDPAHSMVARLSANQGVTRFAVINVNGDGDVSSRRARLCDLITGKPLSDASVRSVLVDASLRGHEDFRELLEELSRVLKDGGQVAIKVDRIPNTQNRFANEIFMSLSAVCDAAKTKFEVLGRRRQGGIGTSLLAILGFYRRAQIGQFGGSFFTVFVLTLIFMPVEIVLGLTLNLLAILLNKLDTTGRNYVSCIVIARKVTKPTDSVHGIYEGCDRSRAETIRRLSA